MLDASKPQGLDLAEVIRGRLLVVFIAIVLIATGLNIANALSNGDSTGPFNFSPFLSPAMKEIVEYLSLASWVAIVLGAAMVGIRL